MPGIAAGHGPDRARVVTARGPPMRLHPRLIRPALLLAAGLLLCQATLGADDVDRRKLFARNVKGCVAVMAAGGPASGFIVDVQKGWVVTCQHVVGSRDEVEVILPAYKDGRLIQDRNHYLKTAPRIKAKVLSADVKRDLALIQIDALPAGFEALALATDSGQPGDNLNLIGNPAASGAMWNYSTGTLRAVYQKKFTYKNTSHEVDALCGETQLPANPGDSGGAVFSDKGEVLGVHSGGTPDGVQLMATYIDVVEVRKFLAEPLKGIAKAKTFDEFFNAANDYYHKGDYDKALQAYMEATKLKPDHSEAWRCRASCHIRKKQYDKGIEDATEAIKVSKINANAFNERAVCYGLKGDYQASLADYNEAIRINPNEAMFWNGRAWVYNGLKDHNKAIADANEAIRLKAEFDLAYNERGLALFWLKDYDKAHADFNQALKLQPNYVHARFNRGVTLALLKKTSEAMADLTEVLRLDPTYTNAYKERGSLYFGSNEFKKALQDYNEYLRVVTTDAQVYLWRSWCHEKLGNPAEAGADLKRSKELDSGRGVPR
jgi:tetratricopeptide (TPR) repeat protein